MSPTLMAMLVPELTRPQTWEQERLHFSASLRASMQRRLLASQSSNLSVETTNGTSDCVIAVASEKVDGAWLCFGAQVA